MDNELGPTTALGEGPRKNKCINFPTKIKLNKSLAMSILLDGRESWTLTLSLLRIADDRGRLAFIAADTSVGVPQRRLGFAGSYC